MSNLQEMKRERMFAAAAVPVKVAKAENDDEEDENIGVKVDELLRTYRDGTKVVGPRLRESRPFDSDLS